METQLQSVNIAFDCLLGYKYVMKTLLYSQVKSKQNNGFTTHRTQIMCSSFSVMIHTSQKIHQNPINCKKTDFQPPQRKSKVEMNLHDEFIFQTNLSR